MLLSTAEGHAKIRIHFGRKFVGLDRATSHPCFTVQAPAGGVADGDGPVVVAARFVIGADGAFSRVREELGRLVQRRARTHTRTRRALSPHTRERAKGGARACGRRTSVAGWDGRGGQVRQDFARDYCHHGYKELRIPARAAAVGGGETESAMAPHALHVWPRGEFMMVALPNADKSFT